MTRLAAPHWLRLAACLGVLALGGVVSTAALASDTGYTVKVKVVKPTVPLNATFKVVASGVSANTSQLLVFINITKKCALSAAKETMVSSDELALNVHVTGAYAKSVPEVAHFVGKHHACAYLRSVPPPSPAQLRARAGAVYHVINSPAG